MVSRKHRTPVVLDTNILVGALKSPSRRGPNQRVLRLWLQRRRLQLIVSDELIAEYLGVFSVVLGLNDATCAVWRERFEREGRSTIVQLGRRFVESRDPDDNLLLTIAYAGNAEWLITNDNDLLQLPEKFQRTLAFTIARPSVFLKDFEDT